MIISNIAVTLLRYFVCIVYYTINSLLYWACYYSFRYNYFELKIKFH